MDGECGANTIALTEKHETEKENSDEIEKAMELFGLAKNEGKVKSNGKRKQART